MARDPLAAVSTVSTPQTQRIPGRIDQVRNNAGGYVIGKDLWTKLEDFLVLGTTGGTYYLREDRLTEANVDVMLQAIQEDGPRVVRLVTDISAARPPRAPKNRPAVFALAAAFAYGNPATVQAAKGAFTEVVRTTDHLSMFFGYDKQLEGKPTPQGTAPVTGRALRAALGSWFLVPDVNQVAWKACKARQRTTPAKEAFALRDALRIAHPKADTPQRRALLGWLAGNVTDDDARGHVPAIDDFLTSQAVSTEAEAIQVVTGRGVPWEFLPSEFLVSAKVWEALAGTVGLTALIRNLARMTRIGAIAPFSATAKRVAGRLTDADALIRSRVHPMDIFLALRVYVSGQSQPDPRADAQTWSPVPVICDALEEAYEKSFGHVQPSGRRTLVAVDSSGSMSWRGAQITFGGSPIGIPYEVGCAMAVILKRIEGDNVHVINVDTAIHPSKITARTNLREIGTWPATGGGTDLSLPLSYAGQSGLLLDGVVVFTDGETWAGRGHPSQALDAYRRRYNPEARVVVAALAANGHTIGEPHDAGVLNVAGMDASLPKVVSAFIR